MAKLNSVRVAKVIVFDSENNVLLLRISDWPERPDKSHKPDLPGGEVEHGESSQIGVARELLEETGLQVNPEKLVRVYYDVDAGRGQIVEREVFICRVSEKSVVLSTEHEEYWWSPIERLNEVDIKEPYRYVFGLMGHNNLTQLI